MRSIVGDHGDTIAARWSSPIGSSSSISVWLFGGRIVGVLFWRRPDMDEQESLD